MGNGVREGAVEFQRDVESVTARISAEVSAGPGLGTQNSSSSAEIPPGIPHPALEGRGDVGANPEEAPE